MYDGPGPAGPGCAGRRCPRLTESRHPDRDTVVVEPMRDDIAIAAIIARAAEDERGDRPGVAADRLGGCGAGALHQRGLGGSGRDGARFGGAHLGGGEDGTRAHFLTVAGSL